MLIATRELINGGRLERKRMGLGLHYLADWHAERETDSLTLEALSDSLIMRK